MKSKNSLLYWYPKIKNLDIPMPETEIIKLTSKEIKGYERCEGDCFNLDRLEKEVSKIIDSKFELPVFIRTDEISNKPFWKMSCYLDNKNNIKSNLMEIISGSKLADIFGLSIQAIAVRKYLLIHYPEIAMERLIAIGFGSDKPIAPNNTVEGRMKNRRVEFVVINEEELPGKR